MELGWIDAALPNLKVIRFWVRSVRHFSSYLNSEILKTKITVMITWELMNRFQWKLITRCFFGSLITNLTIDFRNLKPNTWAHLKSACYTLVSYFIRSDKPIFVRIIFILLLQRRNAGVHDSKCGICLIHLLYESRGSIRILETDSKFIFQRSFKLILTLLLIIWNMKSGNVT